MIWGIISAMCFFACYLPQIYKTIKYKDVSGLSFGMFFLSLIGYISNTLYMHHGIGYNTGGVINAILGTLCCIIMLAYILKFKNH